ncbi:hypothetical protein SH661x_002334 [Planctomicrobium sp. SH661]
MQQIAVGYNRENIMALANIGKEKVEGLQDDIDLETFNNNREI